MPCHRAKGVIWDMDGVIVDTAPFHFAAWQQAFAKRGVDFTQDDFKRNFGQRNDAIIEQTLGREVTPDETESIAREKEETFRKLAEKHITALPGAVALIKSLSEHGFRLAIVSSAPQENIQLVTQSLDIGKYFLVIVPGPDVTEGKPSPAGFLLAARKLGVSPEDCIVIEDAIAGIAACRGAGAHCIAVTNTHPREKLTAADLVVDTLEELTVTDFDNLLQPQKSVD